MPSLRLLFVCPIHLESDKYFETHGMHEIGSSSYTVLSLILEFDARFATSSIISVHLGN
jgi:hypothetical protein